MAFDKLDAGGKDELGQIRGVHLRQRQSDEVQDIVDSVRLLGRLIRLFG
jgi:hypothetical protein